MNRDQNPNNFEDRLLAELRANVATREAEAAEVETSTASPAWRRRAPRLAFAGAAVTAVAAAALIVSAGGNDTTAAYAVTPQGNGKVTVEIRDLSDPQGLEKALDAAGVPANVVPGGSGNECDPSNLESADAETGEAAEPVLDTVEVGGNNAARFTVSRQQVHGKTLVLSTTPGPDGKSAVAATVAPEEGSPMGKLVPCAGGQAPAGTVPVAPLQSADEEGAPATR